MSCASQWNAYVALRTQNQLAAAALQQGTPRYFNNINTPFSYTTDNNGNRTLDTSRRLYGEYSSFQIQLRRKYEAMKCKETADGTAGGTKLRTRFQNAPRHILSRIWCQPEVTPNTVVSLPGRKRARIDPTVPLFETNPVLA